MIARTFTATMLGLQALKIDVEVDGSRGTPQFVLIGLPSRAVGEAKERITAALQNCGVRIRSKRTIVNLAPASITKTDPSLDLAIAVGLLQMYGETQLPTAEYAFFGELSLAGELQPIAGALPLVMAVKELGFTHVVIPHKNVDEVKTLSGIQIHPLHHLRQLIEFGQGRAPLPSLTPEPYSPPNTTNEPAFTQIIGQVQAKRALAICAAGSHNLLMIGPPGIGKTLLAKSLPTLLPPVSEAEALEITQIYSVCGLAGRGLITQRPFRAPHHSTTLVGLIGGGTQLKPGEISLAHRGVLFLDELAEFPRKTLETLRQPLEDRQITLTRNQGTLTYPAAFTLVSATNPCPCGYRGSPHHRCRCSPPIIQAYTKRLSGPLLDRIDLHLKVNEVDNPSFFKPASRHFDEEQQRLCQQISAARDRQQQRAGAPAQLTNKAQYILNLANTRLRLSMRSYLKVLKVAQTICDLEQGSQLTEDHISEALQFRPQVF